MHQPTGWPSDAEIEYWRYGGLQRHPLSRWFQAAGAIAQSASRVPDSISSRREHQVISSNLRPVGLDEQLIIPYRWSAPAHRVFVLARTGTDFPEADVVTARQLQPLFVLLDRQITVICNGPASAPAGAALAGLTERELAVLQLVAQGLTSIAIGHRLDAAPRTVEKHSSTSTESCKSETGGPRSASPRPAECFSAGQPTSRRLNDSTQSAGRWTARTARTVRRRIPLDAFAATVTIRCGFATHSDRDIMIEVLLVLAVESASAPPRRSVVGRSPYH